MTAATLDLAAIQRIEQEHQPPLYAKREIALVRGEGPYLFDSDGHRYLDAMSNYGVAILGHADPAFADALADQLRTLTTGHQSFYNDVRAALLEEIAGVQALEPAPAAVTYVLGMAVLGLVDDVFGGGPSPRGWRGHAAAAARGELSTGALKAAGSLGLALYVLSGAPFLKAGTLLSAAVLVLATHVFNLLDLRPGRSIKAFVLLGAGLALATLDLGPLWALGLFVGPILVLLPLDLREVAMLGDTGASVVGAVAGLWLVLALAPLGQAVAAALIAALAVYGELRSISAAVERLPLVRHLDSLGRVRRPVPDSGTRG